MLKIKDNVDLKELEKFGFLFVFDNSIEMIKHLNNHGNVFIERYTHQIMYWKKEDIEDLIKEDLVEKVSDGNE